MSADRTELKQTGSKVLKFTGSMDRVGARAEDKASESKVEAAIQPAEVKCENGVCSVSWKPKRPAA